MDPISIWSTINGGDVTNDGLITIELDGNVVLSTNYQATGVYSQRLVAALHQAGLAVSVLNPAQVKYFALSVLRRTKNDTLDAQIIARFCRERKPLATTAAGDSTQNLGAGAREPSG